MKPVKLQLLATAVAVLTVAAFLAVRGLPPTSGIHRAAETNDLPALEWALRWGVDVNLSVPGCGTPLHAAVSEGRRDMAARLLDLGADPSGRLASTGGTPLHSASYHHGVDIARLLIEAGADVSARDADGATPLHWSGSGDIVRLLVEHGADVNARDSRGNPPLLSGLAWHTERAEALIAAGADVNAANRQGETALHKAVENNWHEVADLLRAHGAKE